MKKDKDLISCTEYQEFASSALQPRFKGKIGLYGFALGLGGETGEVLDAIKKREFYEREDIPIEHIEEELGDIMWYIANICTRYGISLDDVLAKNVKKLRERYQKLYEQERNK